MSTMNAHEKERQEQSMYAHLFNSAEWQSAKIIAVTKSQSIEVNTAPIIQQAIESNKKIVIPRTLPHRQMEFVLLDDDTKFKQKFGIDEPVNGQIYNQEQIDLIIVPGVSFASDHSRLGFGAGYYDRYLSKYGGNTVSLVLSAQIQGKITWPVDEFDVRIGHLIIAEGENNELE